MAFGANLFLAKIIARPPTKWIMSVKLVVVSCAHLRIVYIAPVDYII